MKLKSVRFQTEAVIDERSSESDKMAACAAAACRRALYLGTGFSGIWFLCSSAISDGKRPVLFDTLALVMRLEKRGVPSNRVEAMTELMSEVLNDCMESVLDSHVSKVEMQKLELSLEATLSNFKTEVTGSQDHHFSLLQRGTEKLKSDIEKMRSELMYEIDKAAAGLRLDQNVARRGIRDELNIQKRETNNLAAKLDREIRKLLAHLEAAKTDVTKYCVGTLVAVSVVALAAIRLML